MARSGQAIRCKRKRALVALRGHRRHWTTSRPAEPADCPYSAAGEAKRQILARVREVASGSERPRARGEAVT